MQININGKSYNSFKEYMEDIKNDPNNTTLVWEYQNFTGGTMFIGGKMISMDGSKGVGKCFWKGKTYEGEIEYRGNSLYVGGKYVKEVW